MNHTNMYSTKFCNIIFYNKIVVISVPVIISLVSVVECYLRLSEDSLSTNIGELRHLLQCIGVAGVLSHTHKQAFRTATSVSQITSLLSWRDPWLGFCGLVIYGIRRPTPIQWLNYMEEDFHGIPHSLKPIDPGRIARHKRRHWLYRALENYLEHFFRIIIVHIIHVKRKLLKCVYFYVKCSVHDRVGMALEFPCTILKIIFRISLCGLELP